MYGGVSPVSRRLSHVLFEMPVIFASSRVSINSLFCTAIPYEELPSHAGNGQKPHSNSESCHLDTGLRDFFEIVDSRLETRDCS
jgi:hypothetical protein